MASNAKTAMTTAKISSAKAGVSNADSNPMPIDRQRDAGITEHEIGRDHFGAAIVRRDLVDDLQAAAIAERRRAAAESSAGKEKRQRNATGTRPRERPSAGTSSARPDSIAARAPEPMGERQHQSRDGIELEDDGAADRMTFQLQRALQEARRQRRVEAEQREGGEDCHRRRDEGADDRARHADARAARRSATSAAPDA